MTDAIDEASAAAEDPAVLRESMRKLLGAFSPAITPKKAERKQREKKARSIVDGRTLKAKGRTEQLNVKVRPDITWKRARPAAKGQSPRTSSRPQSPRFVKSWALESKSVARAYS